MRFLLVREVYYNDGVRHDTGDVAINLNSILRIRKAGSPNGKDYYNIQLLGDRIHLLAEDRDGSEQLKNLLNGNRKLNNRLVNK